jgi:hypothetical protein
MTDMFKLIFGILASRFKARATLEAENLILPTTGQCASPSLRRLRLSGRRPSFAGTVLGFGRIGAGEPATVLSV